MIKVIDKFES